MWVGKHNGCNVKTTHKHTVHNVPILQQSRTNWMYWVEYYLWSFNRENHIRKASHSNLRKLIWKQYGNPENSPNKIFWKLLRENWSIKTTLSSESNWASGSFCFSPALLLYVEYGQIYTTLLILLLMLYMTRSINDRGGTFWLVLSLNCRAP